MSRLTYGPVTVGLVYAVFGYAWIVITDLGVATSANGGIRSVLPQTLKGFVFVTLSAVVVYWLARRSTRQLQRAHADLERANRERAIYDRILRHNFRNGLQVVDGNVELARNADDGEREAYMETVEEGCDRLLDVCRDAREFSALIESDPKPESVDLAAKLRAAVAVADGFPAATVDLDLPSSATASAVGAVDVAFRHVVENACEHAGERPHVEVTLEASDDHVEVCIADDGDGVPESERGALAAATEHPLEHSSGLGLRIVQWLVVRSGGALSFEDGGSTVRLSFPRTETNKVASPRRRTEPR